MISTKSVFHAQYTTSLQKAWNFSLRLRGSGDLLLVWDISHPSWLGQPGFFGGTSHPVIQKEPLQGKCPTMSPLGVESVIIHSTCFPCRAPKGKYTQSSMAVLGSTYYNTNSFLQPSNRIKMAIKCASNQIS